MRRLKYSVKKSVEKTRSFFRKTFSLIPNVKYYAESIGYNISRNSKVRKQLNRTILYFALVKERIMLGFRFSNHLSSLSRPPIQKIEMLLHPNGMLSHGITLPDDILNLNQRYASLTTKEDFFTMTPLKNSKGFGHIREHPGQTYYDRTFYMPPYRIEALTLSDAEIANLLNKLNNI